MKIAFIADIHGNFPALKQVFAEIETAKCDYVYVLGDIAGYYCMVNECIDLLRDKKISALIGNHDYYLINDLGCPRSQSANDCLNYQKSIIRPDNMEWLQKLPLTIKRHNLSMVHAGWNDPLDEYMLSIPANYFDNFSESMFFSGHTHVPVLSTYGKKTYCNPGSVGQPRDGDPRASYALLVDDQIHLHRTNYAIDTIAKAMDEAGFSPYYYENLYNGTCIGGKVLNFKSEAT